MDSLHSIWTFYEWTEKVQEKCLEHRTQTFVFSHTKMEFSACQKYQTVVLL